MNIVLLAQVQKGAPAAAALSRSRRTQLVDCLVVVGLVSTSSGYQPYRLVVLVGRKMIRFNA